MAINTSIVVTTRFGVILSVSFVMMTYIYGRNWEPSIRMYRRLGSPPVLSTSNANNCPFQAHPKLWTRVVSNFQQPNCTEMLDNAYESGGSGAASWYPPAPHSSAASILQLVRNCQKLKNKIAFPEQALTEEEKDFPLAYILVGERNADQTLRLFRMLYWPQNVYCFTYDKKSDPDYKAFMLSLAACFPQNVVVNPNPLNVTWAGENVLHNVMPCFPLLLQTETAWRYVQVVSYNDFPLKTNLELVKIMKILNGSNDSELTGAQTHYYYYNRTTENYTKKTVTPGGLVMYGGSYATTMTRDFVQFFTADPTAEKLYKWLHKSIILEEMYWATLIHNPLLRPPGAFPGQCIWVYKFENKWKRFLSRYQLWSQESGDLQLSKDGHTCKGMYTHASCVFGVDDVKWLVTKRELIAHKVYGEYQPAAQYCMEKWHWEKVCAKSTKFIDDNLDYYTNLPAVRYQNLIDKDEFVC